MSARRNRGVITAAALVVGLSLGSVPAISFAATGDVSVKDSCVSAQVTETETAAVASNDLMGPHSDSGVRTVENVEAGATLAQSETETVSKAPVPVKAPSVIDADVPADSRLSDAQSDPETIDANVPDRGVFATQALDADGSGDEAGVAVPGQATSPSVLDTQLEGATTSSKALEPSVTDDDKREDSQGARMASPTIAVRANVAGEGWLGPVGSGEVAGTVGEARQMEAVSISLIVPDSESENYSSSDIQLRAHVENIGWLDWVSGEDVAGTTGEGLRLEALWLRLRDGSALAKDYVLWYRAHVQNVGWMAWTNEGPIGSTGEGLRMEALEVVLLRKGEEAPGSSDGTAFLDGTKVSVRAHVENDGWHGWTAKPGETAGSTGRGLRLEAISAEIENAYLSGGIEYDAHVQNIGRQGWRDDGAIAGTTGQGLRIEALRMRLTGELAQHYDVWYRAHTQNFGWMAWVSNEQSAGTQGIAGRMEALQVILRPKGSAAPTSSDQGVSFAFVGPTSVSYSAHVAYSGWQPAVSDGAVAGTVGQGRQVEALTIQVAGGENSIPGGVVYRAYVADYGWLDWKAGGEVAGTTGQGRRVEAIQVQLTGELSRYFDIYYQSQIADVGWLGWASDGSNAGSTGIGRALEAFRIQLVFKGNPAPGSSWRATIDQNTQLSGYYGYQTPGNYYKVSTNRVYVGGSGIFAYSSPVRISSFATRQDCINAFITRALDYVGTTPYVWDYACAPGVGVDCAGLVMQALYATGMDLGPHYTPYRHYYVPGNDHYANDMANDGRFARVYSAQRGDLVFMRGHVAIYLGNGRIVEAANPRAGVRITNLYFTPTVIRRPFV